MKSGSRLFNTKRVPTTLQCRGSQIEAALTSGSGICAAALKMWCEITTAVTLISNGTRVGGWCLGPSIAIFPLLLPRLIPPPAASVCLEDCAGPQWCRWLMDVQCETATSSPAWMLLWSLAVLMLPNRDTTLSVWARPREPAARLKAIN